MEDDSVQAFDDTVERDPRAAYQHLQQTTLGLLTKLKRLKDHVNIDDPTSREEYRNTRDSLYAIALGLGAAGVLPVLHHVQKGSGLFRLGLAAGLLIGLAAVLRDLQHGDALDRLLGTLREAQTRLDQQRGVTVPLVIKIAPDMDSEEILFVARALADALASCELSSLAAAMKSSPPKGAARWRLPRAREAGPAPT